MRCDGARPTCTQCLRGDRAIDCEYTDGNRRPRTLALEEDVARLQARVQELENPDTTTPSLTLHDPYMHNSQSTTSANLLPTYGSGATASNYSSGLGFDQVPRVPQEVNPARIQHAIDTISPYTHDLGVFLNLPRLRAHPTNIAPALRDALALMSLHLAQTSGGSQQSESASLSCALHSLTDAFSAANPRLGPQYYVQILQAQVLLAYYFHRVYQTPAAQCHANGAIALAVGLGLHMRSGDAPAPGLFNFVANCHPRLPRPSDAVEEQERVGAWWTIYSLVKFLEMIHPGPPVVATAVRITVPWPGSNDQSGVEHPGDTVALFLSTPNFNPQLGTAFGLQARASALLGEAHSLTAAHSRDPQISQTPDFRNRLNSLDHLLQNFFAGLPHPATIPVSPGAGNLHSLRQLLLTINLVALAQITLHRPFMSSHATSHKRCVDSAVRAVQSLNVLCEFAIANPMCMASLGAVFFVLHDELVHIRQRSRGHPSYNPGSPFSPGLATGQGSNQGEAEIVRALRKLVSVFRTMPEQYPLHASVYAKFEAAMSFA